MNRVAAATIAAGIVAESLTAGQVSGAELSATEIVAKNVADERPASSSRADRASEATHRGEHRDPGGMAPVAQGDWIVP
jgi:hypothetical protein